MKKTLAVTVICIILLIIAYLQITSKPAKGDPRGNLYTGAKACAKCHQKIYNSYLHTAHFMASNPVENETAPGSFSSGNNIFVVNKTQKVVIEKRGNHLFQTYYLKGKVKQRYRLDVVFGGVKGESYLYWKGSGLYQLPLSYFNRENKWVTSRGYEFNSLDYSQQRSIGRPCMECHTSYISDLPGESAQKLAGNEQFDKATLVYHVDCERCHGPGAKHVDFQTEHPGIKTARFIATYHTLSRQQRLDICAVCHSGKPTLLLRSTFEFVPGDTLARFKLPGLSRPADTLHLDVHGDQLPLLQSSKCFINSNMDCATCHDVHSNSRGDDALYTQKCLICHTTAHNWCKMDGKLSITSLKANCINCHMPSLPTKVISAQVSAKLTAIQFFVHTHHIAVYPEQTKKILAFVNRHY